MKQMLFLLLAAQLEAFGKTVADLDVDKTGADDVFGRIVMPSGGRMLRLSATGKIAEADSVIDEIIDGLCEYRGRTVPPPVSDN